MFIASDRCVCHPTSFTFLFYEVTVIEID